MNPSQAPLKPPSQLQNVYDTYAENIHAISIRAGSNSSLNRYGSVVDSFRRPRSESNESEESTENHPDTDTDWRITSWQTSFHLISFMAGSGLVFLPLALVEINWYGLILLVLAAAVCIYTSKLLVEAMDILRWSSGKSVTYCDLAKECLGQNGYYVTAVLLHSGFLISSTGYVALVTSCITGMTGANYGTVLCFIGLSVSLHILIKSLKALALFSAVNVGVCFWIEAVIFGDAMYPLKQIALEQSAFIFGTPDPTDVSLPLKLAYLFSLLASGFFCHSVIPTFYNVMKHHSKCGAVVLRSQTSVASLLYLPVCVVTYAVYGATLQAPVFFNMRNPAVRYLAIVLYCVHLLLSYIVTLYPLQRAIERVFLGRGEDDDHRFFQQPAMLGLFSRVRANSQPSESEQRRQRGLQYIIRLGTVLATLLLAYVFRPTALGIFGAEIIPATTLSLILPCIFFWKLCTEEAGCLDKAAIVVIIALAVVSMCSSVAVIVRYP